MISACQSNAPTLEIPAEIEGKPVRSIGRKAFAQKQEIQSVIIPDSVNEIGVLAFELCSGLNKVVLGKSVVSLGDGAFASCYALQDMRLPEGLVSVGSGAFRDCRGLSRVVLPASLRTLGGGAFAGCSASLTLTLAEGSDFFTMRDGVLFNRDQTTLFVYPATKSQATYVIPDTVTCIAGSAFENCRDLQTISIPPSVTYIGTGAFNNCAKLEHIRIPNGVTRVEWMTFKSCSSLTNVVFGNQVTNICAEAFFGCSSLRRVVIPDSVLALGDSAFSTCGSLEDVTLGAGLERLGTWVFGSARALKYLRLPDSLKSIGHNAFADCSITNVVVIGPNINELSLQALMGINNYVIAEDNPTYRVQEGVLFNRDMTRLIIYPPMRKNATYQIPDGVTTVASRAFMGARWLKSCVMPATLTNIGEYAFYQTSLEELTLPDSVTTIGMCAFANCSALRNVTSLGSITTLDHAVLSHNDNLVRIVLPATLKKIEYVLADGSSLAEIVVADGNNTFRSSDGVLFNHAMTTLLRYPPKRLGTEYRMPDCITSVGDYAFVGAVWLTNLLLAASVTNIGVGAFNRVALRQLAIPDGIRRIGSQAFSYAPQLETVFFEGDMPTIKAEGFERSSATVYYREGANGWSKDTAYGRPALGISTDGRFHFSVHNGQTVTIRRYSGTQNDVRVPAMLAGLPVTVIGTQAFASSAILKSVTIPAGVTGLATRAFAACANLANVFFEGHAPNADTDVFQDSPADIYHRSDTQGWTMYFAKCPALTFSYDSGFAFMPEAEGSMTLVRCFDTNRTVTVPVATDGKPVAAIGSQAFAGCRELVEVTIPASVRRIGARAFDHCYRLKSVAGAQQVTEVGAAAFATCYSLTNVVVAGQPQGGGVAVAAGVAARQNLCLYTKSGDKLTCSTALRAVSLRMSDAVLSVPLAHISKIKPGAGDAADCIQLITGDMLEGQIERRPIDVVGHFGVAAIDLRLISTLEVVPPDTSALDN